MKSIFFNAAVISIVYILFSFIEMRYILKNKKSMKELMRDGLIVYFSIIVGDFVLSQFLESSFEKSGTEAFIDQPDF